MIEDTYRGMNEIKTLLLGAKNSSDCGLVGEVQQVRKDFYSFRNKCLINLRRLYRRRRSGDRDMGTLQVAWLRGEVIWQKPSMRK